MLIPRASRGSDPGRICHMPAGLQADGVTMWFGHRSRIAASSCTPPYDLSTRALPRTKSGGEGFRPQRAARVGWRPHGDSNPGRNRERVVS